MENRLLKEWNNYEEQTGKVLFAFRLWSRANIIASNTRESIEDQYGFPYTSSGEYAAIWNVQCKAVYRWSKEWRFEGLAISDKHEIVAIFEHEDGTIETLDRMYIIIGKE